MAESHRAVKRARDALQTLPGCVAEAIVKDLDATLPGLDKGENVTAAVVGGTGHGKSSLINRIIGHGLLPSGKGWSTSAVPVLIRKGQRDPMFKISTTMLTMGEFIENVDYLLDSMDEPGDTSFRRAKEELVAMYEKYGFSAGQWKRVLQELKTANSPEAINKRYDRDVLPYPYTSVAGCLKSQTAWARAVDLSKQLECSRQFPDATSAAIHLRTVAAVASNKRDKELAQASDFDWRIVKHATVWIGDLPFSHLELIDVPGTDDTSPLRNKRHTEFLKDADHIVLAVSSNRCATDARSDYYFESIASEMAKDGRAADKTMTVFITNADQADLNEAGVDSVEDIYAAWEDGMRERLQPIFGPARAAAVSVRIAGKGLPDLDAKMRQHLISTERSAWDRKNERGRSALKTALEYADWAAGVGKYTALGAPLYISRVEKDVEDDAAFRSVSGLADTLVATLSNIDTSLACITRDKLLCIHAASLKCIVKRNGAWGFKEGDTRISDFNNYIIQRHVFTPEVDQVWASSFAEGLDSLMQNMQEKFEGILSKHMGFGDILLPNHTVSQFRQIISDACTDVRNAQKNDYRSAQALLQEEMSAAYSECATFSGTGVRVRIVDELQPALCTAIGQVALRMQGLVRACHNPLEQTERKLLRALSDLKEVCALVAQSSRLETQQVLRALEAASGKRSPSLG